MKRTLTTLFIGLALAISAFAVGGQDKPATKQAEPKPADVKPTGATPTVDQILEKYVQATGGKANIEKATSRVSKGTFEIPDFGAGGTAEIYEKAPNKSLAVINVSGFGMVLEGYNGTVAWAQDPQSGLREKSGAELAAAKLDTDLHKALKMKQLYPKMTLKGKVKVGEKEAYQVEMIPAESSAEQWYFDVESGLLVRQDAERESPMGKMAIQTYLENYKDVDGVKIPFTMRQVSPMFNIIIKIDEVKHNVPIDDAKFNKPASQ